MRTITLELALPQERPWPPGTHDRAWQTAQEAPARLVLSGPMAVALAALAVMLGAQEDQAGKEERR